ncbi:hypothetical protein ACGFYU_13565 [Streptomyces sp. NPDC048337]|uniref:hypothetical protein n=1 Tax=Streptomyces sp. NPDC048337 TaxID=3365535 RepID=UPI00371CCDCA
MAVTQIVGHWFKGSGNQYTTIDVVVAPIPVYVTAVLHGTAGGGTSYAGIKHFRRRLPSGAEEEVDFGDWPNWPPSVFDRMTRITFGTATTANQSAWLYARFDFWE